VHVRTNTVQSELRLAIKTAVELTNDHRDGNRVRQVLVDTQYARASEATDREIEDVHRRFASVADLVQMLPSAELEDVVAALNNALDTCQVQPSLQAHDGSALHVHWTQFDAPFSDQVVVDVLIALAQVISDHGVSRFGQCGASDCFNVFYDPTKNHSRRFCSDPKCASRTHTAEHRARRNAST